MKSIFIDDEPKPSFLKKFIIYAAVIIAMNFIRDSLKHPPPESINTKENASHSDNDLGAETTCTEATLNNYVRNVERKINRGWNPTLQMADSPDNTMVFYFEVLRNGELKKLHLKEPNTPNRLTKYSLMRIHHAQPFSRLPKCYSSQSLPIEITLEFNIKH